ncbi:MAG: hypothetical protein JXA54_04180 [Candidatus Heimdallarchaeota archaeon]|nr:hypothetical protein [Candidatus Heimdallarchaeota archaeon]
MGYFKGFITTLAITYPSFFFIRIYLDGVTIANYFADIMGGQWIKFMEAFETAITEPISAFFDTPINGIKVTLALLPWFVAAFVCSFFFRKKNAARGGLATIALLMFGVQAFNFIYYQGNLIGMHTLTEPNPAYGLLVVLTLTSLIGPISGSFSPFKKDRAIVTRVRRTPSPHAEEQDLSGPYYMPTESPSRDSYMATNHQSYNQQTRPVNCEYCGSYLDEDSDFCSVCGNRVYND